MQSDRGHIAGTFVVRRGASHPWRNPLSDAVCRTAFTLIEATPIVIDGHVLAEVQPFST